LDARPQLGDPGRASSVFHSLKTVLCVACLLYLWIPGVHAATWQEHKTAGFSAFDNGDYAAAVEQLKVALTIAYEEQTPPQVLGSILENLATAFLAADQPQRAGEAIERWDKILAESADEPWAPEQQTVRDNLAQLVIEALARTEPTSISPDTDLAIDAASSPPAPVGYAIHLESVKTRENVQPSWNQLKATYPFLLADTALVVTEVDLGDQGTFYRILAASFAKSADAEKACREFERLGQYCDTLSLE
jgi:hypothetical protein